MSAESALLTQSAQTALAHRDGPSLGKPKTLDQARKVAQDFEAFFLSQMIQPLFANLGAEEPFGGGSSEQIWRSLQVDEFGKAMAKQGGVGLADSVLAQILKMQELSQT